MNRLIEKVLNRVKVVCFVMTIITAGLIPIVFAVSIAMAIGHHGDQSIVFSWLGMLLASVAIFGGALADCQCEFHLRKRKEDKNE
jgi:steroid 5-alpha reductase family enzyme